MEAMRWVFFLTKNTWSEFRDYHINTLPVVLHQGDAQRKTRCVAANLCSIRNPLRCPAERICSRKICCAALQKIFAAGNSFVLRENPKSTVQHNCLSFEFSFIFSLSWIFFSFFLNSIHLPIFSFIFFFTKILFSLPTSHYCTPSINSTQKWNHPPSLEFPLFPFLFKINLKILFQVAHVFPNLIANLW